MMRAAASRVTSVLGVSIAIGLVSALLAGAQIAAGAPAGQPRVMCKDGTVATTSGRGACRGHGGIAKDQKAKKRKATAEEKRAPETAARGAKPRSSTKSTRSERKAEKRKATAEEKRAPETAARGAKPRSSTKSTRSERQAEKESSDTRMAEAAGAAASTSSSRSAPGRVTSSRAEAAGGMHGGEVWVNTESMVYHCPGDHWYGNTKSGRYMTEAQARAQGARPSRGKGCT
ncbi:MAG TPA: hypothetical protein VHE11_05565 [Steroidobacteraceae bacterium]|nr:hypothetical protein [Steroidobacteraceae bacterium]